MTEQDIVDHALADRDIAQEDLAQENLAGQPVPTAEDSSRRTTRALGRLDFGTVLDGAARLRPDRPYLSDRADGPALCFADVDAAVTTLATQMMGWELGPRRRALLVCATGMETSLLVFAALRAGLDLALAPAYLEAEEVRGFAEATRSAALIFDEAALDLRGADAALRIAAALPDIRLIAAMSPLDGVVRLDPSADVERVNFPATAGRIRLRGADGSAIVHEQGELLDAALSMAAQVRIGAHQPILSTMLLCAFAGLVAGPLAALLAGTRCVLHGPFDEARFRDDLTGLAPCHLVVPQALMPALAGESLADGRHCASLILTRVQDEEPASLELLDDTRVPIFDLATGGPLGYGFSARERESTGHGRHAPTMQDDDLQDQA